VNRKRLLARLAHGHLQNVAFRDMMNLAEGLGFRLDRVSGSHHVLTHDKLSEFLNLQDWGGEAKPYQIRQFLRLVEKYNLRLEDEG
jgi:hypothetical protein